MIKNKQKQKEKVQRIYSRKHYNHKNLMQKFYNHKNLIKMQKYYNHKFLIKMQKYYNLKNFVKKKKKNLKSHLNSLNYHQRLKFLIKRKIEEPQVQFQDILQMNW